MFRWSFCSQNKAWSVETYPHTLHFDKCQEFCFQALIKEHVLRHRHGGEKQCMHSVNYWLVAGIQNKIIHLGRIYRYHEIQLPEYFRSNQKVKHIINIYSDNQKHKVQIIGRYGWEKWRREKKNSGGRDQIRRPALLTQFVMCKDCVCGTNHYYPNLSLKNNETHTATTMKA